jgi:transposase
MTQKAIDMTQAKQIQQLSTDGVSIKEIVRRTGISRKTVRKYLRKIEASDHTLQVEAGARLPDKELAAIIYNNDSSPVSQRRFEALIKHFDDKKDSLHKTGVTKQLLWVEYIIQCPEGYKYSQYCYLFKKYLKDTDPAFHWEYSPGEFTQIDFAGKPLFYADKSTGEMNGCQIFVAILPYSGLIFAIAVLSQKTQDFAHCINEMVKYFRGVTKTILCDNFKTAVTRADKHEPEFTELCLQLAAHYNTTFSATRSRAPKDYVNIFIM